MKAKMPMNTLKNALFLLIMLLLASSCTNMQLFKMDILQPGYIVVPSQKGNIVVVDNSAVQPNNAGHVVKVNFKTVGDTAFNTEPLSGFLISSLNNYLLKEGFYKQITPILRSQFVPGKTGEDDFLRSARLSNAQLIEISKDTSIHLLFSLDRLLTKTTTNTYFTGETFAAARDVWVNSVWRIYDLDVDTLIAQFQYNDSLYWIKYNVSAYSALRMLPKMADVLPEIGDVVAEHLNKFMGPHWVTEAREYFSTGSYRMKMAADLVRKERIGSAAELWAVEFERGFMRTKYRAAINMMLYEEVMGNPVKAMKWVDKAAEAMRQCPIGASDYDQELLRRWKTGLKDRLVDFEKLKIYFDGTLN